MAESGASKGDRGRGSEASAQFWDTVEPLLAQTGVDEGTLMGFPCVRAGGEFVAMPHHETGDLVAKLHRDRVTELVESGAGEPFGPGGRVFKEWVLVPRSRADQWASLIEEARRFVAGS
ncbi:MAG TPA: hypothetical protein VGA13_09480 [Acidimicrobiales bacterium]|jgi:hypothetical protein